MNSPLVSIIVVNWNGEKILEDCFRSLLTLKYKNWELIIVDNGSSDSSLEIIEKYKEKFLKFKLVLSQQNLGFSGGNNEGFRVSKGDLILLLNNDTKVTPDLLNILIFEINKDSSLAVIQPKIKIMDKPEMLDNAGSFMTRTGFLEHWGYMEKDSSEFNEKKIIFSAKGACMLIKRDIIERIGLFDCDFGSYFEETDFCWRVWLLGFKVLYCPETFIYHKVGFTSKKQDQVFIFYHSLKNRLLSMIKNFELSNLLFIGGFHIMILIVLSLYYLLRLKFRKSCMIYQALAWNLFHLPESIRKRIRIQKLREAKDSEYFKFIMKPFNIKEMLMHFARVEANFK